ncbi:MAG: CoA-binding protein, partial [Gammaproteobacteria bacterium]
MASTRTERVAILGASSDPDRYAFKAQRLLKEHGHRVVPVSPKEAVVDGDAAVASLGAIEGPVDTLTLYVRPAISTGYREQILALKPARVIFNPGTENPALEKALSAAGIAC